MDSELRRSTLAEYLGGEQLRRLVTKKVFGGYEVPVGPFLTVGLWLFQSGAVLGRARRDQLEILAKMFLGLEVVAQTYLQVGSVQEASEAAYNEQMVLTYIRETAKSLMLDYAKQHVKEPESLYDLWLACAPPEADCRGLKEAKQLAKKKLRLGVALLHADVYLLTGIGFGAVFPELTEKIWRHTYETHPNQDYYDLARRSGLDIPDQFTPLPLEEMEEIVVAGLRSYATEYFPELLGPLGL